MLPGAPRRQTRTLWTENKSHQENICYQTKSEWLPGREDRNQSLLRGGRMLLFLCFLSHAHLSHKPGSCLLAHTCHPVGHQILLLCLSDSFRSIPQLLLPLTLTSYLFCLVLYSFGWNPKSTLHTISRVIIYLIIKNGLNPCGCRKLCKTKCMAMNYSEANIFVATTRLRSRTLPDTLEAPSMCPNPDTSPLFPT